MDSLAQRFFSVLELRDAVFSHLIIPHIVTLLTVNHCFFEGGVRLVWKNVGGLTPIFSLLFNVPALPTNQRDSVAVVSPPAPSARAGY